MVERGSYEPETGDELVEDERDDDTGEFGSLISREDGEAWTARMQCEAPKLALME